MLRILTVEFGKDVKSLFRYFQEVLFKWLSVTRIQVKNQDPDWSTFNPFTCVVIFQSTNKLNLKKTF